MAEVVRPELSDPVTTVDHALFDLLRKMSPKAVARHCRGGHAMPPHLDVVPLLQVVAGGHCTGDVSEVTVGMVAERLAIDPSRASRWVSATIEAGHLTRLASQADGRRSVLAVTPAGQEILAEAERFRRLRYERLLAGWPAEDRVVFARLLTRFVDDL